MAKTQRGYQSFNKSVLMKGLTVQVKNVLEPALLQTLKRVAQKVVTAIDTESYIPEYTSNLHDATGVAVYANGSVSSFIPTKRATKESKSGLGNVNRYEINGNEFLKNTITEASSTFAKGIWFVVISAVPYAYYIDTNGSPLGRGAGFFKKTYEDAVDEILSGLKPIADKVTTKKGITL